MRYLAPVLGLTTCSLIAAAQPAHIGRIELVCDRWGILHVLSETDHGALFGLGYDSAEYRWSSPCG